MTVIPKSEENAFQVPTQHLNSQFEFERKKTNKCEIKDSGCVIVDQNKMKTDRINFRIERNAQMHT